jgi:putative ABC transport system permease protein
MEQWLSSFAYHIANFHGGCLPRGAILTMTITLITVSYHSIKAALANPVESLRNE